MFSRNQCLMRDSQRLYCLRLVYGYMLLSLSIAGQLGYYSPELRCLRLRGIRSVPCVTDFHTMHSPVAVPPLDDGVIQPWFSQTGNLSPTAVRACLKFWAFDLLSARIFHSRFASTLR